MYLYVVVTDDPYDEENEDSAALDPDGTEPSANNETGHVSTSESPKVAGPSADVEASSDGCWKF